MARREISRRGSRHDEEPDDEPRGRSRRDNSEEDAPRRGRSRSSEPDDEPRGRGRSRGRDDEGSEEPRGRSRRSDRDADDDRPRRGRSSDDRDARAPRERGRSTTVGKGWGGYSQVKNLGSSDFVNTWKLPHESTLIKILDEEPFSTYAEHWIDERKGKKSFVCLGDDCPLCAIGDTPKGFALFNILDLAHPDTPKVEVWKVGKQVGEVLERYSKDDKTSPINRDDLYFDVFLSGGTSKGGNKRTNIATVKARDLVEDWDVEPFTEDELDEFYEKLKTEEDILYINSRKELQEIADELD